MAPTMIVTFLLLTCICRTSAVSISGDTKSTKVVPSEIGLEDDSKSILKTTKVLSRRSAENVDKLATKDTVQVAAMPSDSSSASTSSESSSSPSTSSLSSCIGIIVGPVLAAIAVIDVGVACFLLRRAKAVKCCKGCQGSKETDAGDNYEVPIIRQGTLGENLPLQSGERMSLIVGDGTLTGDGQASVIGATFSSESGFQDISSRPKPKAPAQQLMHDVQGTQHVSRAILPADQQENPAVHGGTEAVRVDDPYYHRIVPESYEKLTSVATGNRNSTSSHAYARFQTNDAPYAQISDVENSIYDQAKEPTASNSDYLHPIFN